MDKQAKYKVQGIGREYEIEVIGCVGAAMQDFIARADLYPFLIALYVAEHARGQGIARALIERVKDDIRRNGFASLYLCTDLRGLYEKFGFHHIAQSYDVFGFKNEVYECQL